MGIGMNGGGGGGGLVLDRVAVAFEELSGDEELVLPGYTGEIALGDAGRVLLAPGTSRAEVDVIWRGVVLRARCESVWQVVALGLALPAFRGIVRRAVAVSGVDADDVSSEVVAAFLEELRRVDVAGPGVFSRLRAAANAAGMRLARRSRGSAKPILQQGVVPLVEVWCCHPDAVLARAVASGVVTASEADLIGITRLEGLPVAAVARLWRVRVEALWQRRSRAERRLTAWLRDRSTNRAGAAVGVR